MSTLKVTNIAGLTGSSTNVIDGLVKAWANMSGSGTPAFRDTFNSSSITDHSTGQFTVAFSSSMNNNDYSCPSAGSQSDTIGAVAMCVTPRALTTSNYRFHCEYNNGSYTDFQNIFLSTLGDLA